MNMMSNPVGQNESGLEIFIDNTLEIHSAVSIAVTHELRLTAVEGKRARLKKALSLIDQLDFLLGSPVKIKNDYPKLQRELFQLLESLRIPVPQPVVYQGN